MSDTSSTKSNSNLNSSPELIRYDKLSEYDTQSFELDYACISCNPNNQTGFICQTPYAILRKVSNPKHNHIESKKEKSVSEFCNHKIGVGAVFDKLSKYLSFGMDQGDLRINSEIVAFNYNNMTKTFPLPNSTYARMKYVYYANDFDNTK